MKTIIFSDTHLSQRFEQRLFTALVKTLRPADRIIINGDFWDSYLTSFDNFVNSEWRRLFKLLLSKKTVYLFGNHDPRQYADQRLSLFSVVQKDSHTFTHWGIKYHVQHGHQLYGSFPHLVTDRIPHAWSQTANRWLQRQEAQHTPIGQLYSYFEHQADLSAHRYLMAYFSHLGLPKNERYILGHTHVRHFEKKSPYLNPGRFTAEHPLHLAF